MREFISTRQLADRANIRWECRRFPLHAYQLTTNYHDYDDSCRKSIIVLVDGIRHNDNLVNSVTSSVFSSVLILEFRHECPVRRYNNKDDDKRKQQCDKVIICN
ncbi:hypothetical protein LTS15_005454 [Exophiala xenobiotica]|nr:hypothetical protein LTS15_005454 [Exophiala xenobiotica]